MPYELLDDTSAPAAGGFQLLEEKPSADPAGILGTAYDKYARALMGMLPGGRLVDMGLQAADTTPGTASKNLIGGSVKGASNIGATALWPVDRATDIIQGDRGPTLSGLATGKQPLSRNEERRQEVTQALQGMGVDTDSGFFKGGQIGAEVAGTSGAPGLVAKGLRAAPLIGRYAAPVASAIESGGMSTGLAPTTFAGKAGNLLLRAGGGAAAGGLQVGMTDPSQAAAGAAIGGVAPLAIWSTGSLLQGVGRALRGPEVHPTLLASAANAQAAGYVLPPTQVRPSLGNRLLEGTAGKLTTAQNASAANQEVTNRLAKQAIGAMELSDVGLQAVRDRANAAYTALGNAGPMTADTVFQQAVQKIGAGPASFAQQFPQAVSKDIDQLTQSYAATTGFDAQNGIEAIKRLREAQRAAMGPSATAEQKAYGKAQGKIAGALEDLMERNLTTSGQTDLLTQFRDARQMLAKTYDVEKALNATTGNVDARVLARQLDKGRPMTGDLRTAAEFGQAFPTAAKVPEKMGSLPQFSPLDLFTVPSMSAIGAGAMGPYGIAAGAAVPVVRTGARYAALSGPVQRSLVRQPAPLLPAGGLQVDPLVTRSLPFLLTGP